MSVVYTQVDFEIVPLTPFREVLTALLGELEYESFVDTPQGMSAYIPQKDFDQDALVAVVERLAEGKISFTSKEIAPQNWNAAWESSFEPIFVEEHCTIRAPFHDPSIVVGEEIIITPQMSFGTGHHETTWLVTRALFALDCVGKTVLDMGCGTGVLAIATLKRGAATALAIDIDHWACENTIQNFALNGLEAYELREGGAEQLKTSDQFDLILANINKNILLQDLKHYAAVAKTDCTLILSGFFESDKKDLVEAAKSEGFDFERMETKNHWAMLVFKRLPVS